METQNQKAVHPQFGWTFARWVLATLASLSVLLSACSSLRGPGSDASLDAACVRLMEGAITRDQAVIQPLLAPDFSWREDKAPIDEEPYDFWTRHRLWQEFGAALKEKLTLKEGMMLGPVRQLPDGGKGARLAWRKVGNEWRLAYFYASIPAAQ